MNVKPTAPALQPSRKFRSIGFLLLPFLTLLAADCPADQILPQRVQFQWGGGRLLFNNGGNAKKEVSSIPAAFQTGEMVDEEKGEVMIFANGNRISGSLSGCAEDVVTWTHPSALDPIRLKTEAIHSMVFYDAKQILHKSDPAEIELVNGDLIPGVITAITPDVIKLTTSFAGELTVKRDHVAYIRPKPTGGSVLFSGPMAGQDWKILPKDGQTVNGQKMYPWAYHKSAFYSNPQLQGSCTFNPKLPDKVSIRMTIEWRGNMNFWVSFFNDIFGDVLKPEGMPQAKFDEEQKARKKVVDQINQSSSSYQHPGNSYVLFVNSYNLNLQKTTIVDNGNVQYSQTGLSIALTEFRRNAPPKFDLEIRADRQRKLLAFYLDGKLVNQHTETDMPFAGRGTGVVFSHYGGNSQVKLSNIIISSWNGQLETAPPLKSKEHDVLVLLNKKERMSGTALEMAGNGMKFNSQYGSHTIPTEEIVELQLNPSSRKKIPFGKSKGTLMLSNRGAITLRISGVDSEFITGESPALGEVKLQRGIVSEIKLLDQPIPTEPWVF